MYSDDELLETVMGAVPAQHEPRSKRRRMVDMSGFEDIARELEEDVLQGDVKSEGEGEGESQDEDDTNNWLLRQYAVSENEGEGTSEQGEEGMDLDLEDLLEDGGGVEKVKEQAEVLKEEPVKEKAAYTSSGRLLVPSHKSREAKAVAGAMAAAWEEMEMEMEMGEKKKPSGSKVSSCARLPGCMDSCVG
jgi:hypothetical protein